MTFIIRHIRKRAIDDLDAVEVRLSERFGGFVVVKVRQSLVTGKKKMKNCILISLILIFSCNADNVQRMNDNNKITIKPANAVYSGDGLVIIPENPHYKPTNNQINLALDIIQKEYPANEIISELYDSVNFIAPGQNFEKVSCNHCLKELSMNFWHEKMDDSYGSSHFDEMDFKTECCGKITSLNELIYEGDCGFASYEISIDNVEPNDKKENELRENLPRALGAKVKLFWRNI